MAATMAVRDFEGQNAALLEAARPDVYLRNAFRVTELPVDATPSEVRRQLKVLERTAGPRTRGPLALDPPPDGNAIREARDRLREPERRLVDELFWFWPRETGRGRRDEAIGALASGDPDRASELWRVAVGAGAVAGHNLAVLAHARALDIELAGRGNGAAGGSTLGVHWKDAHGQWSELLADERFWERVRERIRDVGDPRLTTGLARRIRASLPLALLSINAQLAVAAAEEGDDDTLRRHLAIIADSSYDEAARGEALRRAIAPVRDRIRSLCSDTEAQIPPSAEAAGLDLGERLLTQTKPLLAIVDRLVPGKRKARAGAPLATVSALRDALRDQVALTVQACLVPYANASEDWEGTVKLLRRAGKVAATKSARSRIEDNVKVLEGNIAAAGPGAVLARCWFCQDQAPTAGKEITVPMYGDVTSRGYSLSWRHGSIPVPRCARCASFHSRRGLASFLAVIFWLTWAAAMTLALGNPENAWLAVAVVSGLWLVTFLGRRALLARFRAKQSWPRGLETTDEFPLIAELKEQGWRRGEKPPEANQ